MIQQRQKGRKSRNRSQASKDAMTQKNTNNKQRQTVLRTIASYDQITFGFVMNGVALRARANSYRYVGTRTKKKYSIFLN